MKVKELMTTDVQTVAPEASLKDAAAGLVSRGISGMPVCDAAGHVIGVFSEGDILSKEHDPGPRRGGVLAWLGVDDPVALAKAAARTVGEAMTAPAITIGPETSVSEAARLMSEHGVNRLPVLRRDELIGIVTRADLVRAFTRTDAEIRQEIEKDILERTLWDELHDVEIDVTNGVVKLRGLLASRSDAALLERLTARVPGVISVEAELRWKVDDMSRHVRREAERSMRQP